MSFRRRAPAVAVMAIDLSLTSTGIVSLRRDFMRTLHVDAESFGISLRYATHAELMNRLEQIEAFVLRKWRAAGSPKDVAIEEYGFSYAGESYVFARGEAGGVVKMALHRRGVRIRPVVASQARKFLMGFSPRKRVDAKREVKTTLEAFGFEGLDEDTRDALVVGNWLMGELGHPCLYSPERERQRWTTKSKKKTKRRATSSSGTSPAGRRKGATGRSPRGKAATTGVKRVTRKRSKQSIPRSRSIGSRSLPPPTATGSQKRAGVFFS